MSPFFFVKCVKYQQRVRGKKTWIYEGLRAVSVENVKVPIQRRVCGKVRAHSKCSG
jgi:hypothetical protein